MDYCFITYHHEKNDITMAAQKFTTPAVDVPTSARRESTFLSLSPFQSTPPASEPSNSAVASPMTGSAPSISEVIEPLKKVERSASESSTASTSSFLRLGPVEHDE